MVVGVLEDVSLSSPSLSVYVNLPLAELVEDCTSVIYSHKN